jgi:hypothetical protein
MRLPSHFHAGTDSFASWSWRQALLDFFRLD